MAILQFDVRLRPLLVAVTLGAAAVNLVLGVWLLLLGVLQPALFLGLILLGVGIAQARRLYFWVTHRPTSGFSTLESSSRRGALADGVTAGPGERFAVERGRLVHIAVDGTRTRAPVRRLLAHPADWRALEAGLASDAPHKPVGPGAPDGS